MKKYENIKSVISDTISYERRVLSEANINYFADIVDSLYGDKLEKALTDFGGLISYISKGFVDNNYMVCYGAVLEIKEYPYIIEGLKKSDMAGHNGLITTLLARPTSLGKTAIDIVKKLRLYFELFDQMNILKERLNEIISRGQYKNFLLRLRKESGALVVQIDTILKKINSIPIKLESLDFRQLKKQGIYEDTIPNDKFLVFWKQAMGKIVSRMLNTYLNQYKHKFDGKLFKNKNTADDIKQDILTTIRSGKVYYDNINNDILKIYVCLPIVYYSAFLTNMLYFIDEVISNQSFLANYGLEDLSDEDYSDTTLMSHIANELAKSHKLKVAISKYIEKPCDETKVNVNSPIIYIQESVYKATDIIAVFDSLSVR